MYILIAILIFGLIIATHELGHFMAAKACGVRVLEFSIGMGPAIFKRQGKETLYSLRLLPIGGFCAMEGEDESSDDPRAFSNQAFLKRLVILVAGAAMNFLFGLLIIIGISTQAQEFQKPTITGFMEGCPYVQQDGVNEGFKEGDTFYKINGNRVYLASNVSMLFSRGKTDKFDIVVKRDGEKVLLKDYQMKHLTYEDNGEEFTGYGFKMHSFETGALARLKFAFYYSIDCVRLVKFGLMDLIGGSVGIKEMSGPVGIVGVINDVGKNAENTAQGTLNVLNLAAFISINIGVMNLLPLPALDGGRVVFMALTWVIEKLTRKKLDPKYEGYVHAAGLVLLLGLSVVVMYNDIVRLVTGG